MYSWLLWKRDAHSYLKISSHILNSRSRNCINYFQKQGLQHNVIPRIKTNRTKNCSINWCLFSQKELTMTSNKLHGYMYVCIIYIYIYIYMCGCIYMYVCVFMFWVNICIINIICVCICVWIMCTNTTYCNALNYNLYTLINLFTTILLDLFVLMSNYLLFLISLIE